MRMPVLAFVAMAIFIPGHQSIHAQTGRTHKPASDQTNKVVRTEEERVRAVWEDIVIAVGNGTTEAFSDLVSKEAVIGWTYLQDGVWCNKTITQKGYLQQMAEAKDPEPYSEVTQGFDVTVTQGRVAMAKAETIISQFGVPRSREVNHVLMMKEKDDWRLFSIAWTVHRLPEAERKFDLNLFARSYAQVWGSNRPAFVAMFFEENGSLQVNDGDTAVGRDAISNTAKSFMTRFPDMKVSFDSLTHDGNGTRFHWTLTGTDASPGGKGNTVNISGYELWQMGIDGRIKKSKGYFSAEEYSKQLEREREK